MKAINRLYFLSEMHFSSVIACIIFVVGCHAERSEGLEKHTQAALIQSQESQDCLFSGKGQLVPYLEIREVASGKEIREVASGKHFFILVPNQNIALSVDSLVTESPHFLSLSELTNFVWSFDSNFEIEESHEQPLGSGKYKQVLSCVNQTETLCREQVDRPMEELLGELTKSSKPSIRYDSVHSRKWETIEFQDEERIFYCPFMIYSLIRFSQYFKEISRVPYEQF